MHCQSSSAMASTAERCPVCRLFLLPDMLLSEHLDTHPKDQVILALTNLLDKQNKTVPRCLSPWSPKSSALASSLSISSPQTNTPPENHRLQWSDSPERMQSWQKPPQQMSWSYSPRYSIQNSSRYTQWQPSLERTHNSTYVNDMHYEPLQPSSSERCMPYNDIPNNQIQFATPVTRRNHPTIAESSQCQQNNVILSSTIPVIQRNENLSMDDTHLPDAPTCIYKSINYIEHENSYNSHCTDGNNLFINNVLDQRLCSSQSTIVSESVINKTDNISISRLSNCKNDIIERTCLVDNSDRNITITRKEVIIQPEKSKIVNIVPTGDQDVSINRQGNEEYSESRTQKILPKEITINNLVLSKTGTSTKNNIEILSHSVINNSKLIKRPEVKKLMIKQKKNDLIDSELDIEEIIETETESSLSKVKHSSPSHWSSYVSENSEIKLNDSEENAEKSYDDSSELDEFSTEQRKTMFSPNLVVINLETNNGKSDSCKKLLDVDSYQQSLDNRSVYEFSKDLNRENVSSIIEYDNKLYDAPSDFKQDTSPNKSSNTSFHSQFGHSDGNLDEFSSHSGSKLNNSENSRQNLEHSLSSESLNIQTDEKMPARGELSEQESTDSSTWAYQNACSSFQLNLPSEGNELNLSQYLTPMLEPSSSRSSNPTESGESSKSNSVSKRHNLYKCPHCTEEFLCAKERRVHVSREHADMSSLSQFSKNPNETLRNSFNSTEFCYTADTIIQNERLINSYIKEDHEIVSHNNCDSKFDGALLVSSMNIINNNEDIELEPLGKLDIIEDVKSDFNLFNLVQNNASNGYVPANLKIEDIPSTQSTSDATKNAKKRRKAIKRAIKYTFTCIICQEEFKTVSSFNNHLKTHPLECRICAKLFMKKRTFDAHEARHLGYKNIVCLQCNRRFYTEQRLTAHKCMNSTKKLHNCPQCGVKFRTRKALEQHKVSTHTLKISGKVYFCHCGENFPSLAKLYYHKETHDTKPKNCKYCTQKFVHLISLNRHIRVTHNDKMLEDTEVCQICNRNLSKISMRGHMKTHSGSRKHNCFICNKNFTTKWNLKQHKFVHQNRSSKPHKCSLCSSAFLRLQDFKYHMNSHKKIYSFVCNYCGRKFIRKYNYLRHVKEHNQEKKFQCTVNGCTKVFHRKYYLTEHERTHSGMRPFVCTICSKTSTTKSNHNKHLKIHHANGRDSINMEN